MTLPCRTVIFQCRPDRQAGFSWHSCHNSAMWQLSWKLEDPHNCRDWDEGAKEFHFCSVSHSLLLCLFWLYFIPDFCSLPMQLHHGKAKDTCILPMSKSILQPKALFLLSECVTSTPFCASAETVCEGPYTELHKVFLTFTRVLFEKYYLHNERRKISI